MHPAYSVIFFTTASGAGYGLLALAAMVGLAHGFASTASFGLTVGGVALALITGGLLSSTFHLGHPERAWRAISQWRSSWLSREGVAALITYIPAVLFVLLWSLNAEGFARLLGYDWMFGAPGAMKFLAVLTIICCVATVLCTGMIYASLPTIRQWQHKLVVPVYLAFALASGAVLLLAIAHIFGRGQAVQVIFAVGGLALTLGLKLAYWKSIDASERSHTIGAATGLGHLGKIRQLEAPHTAANYLMTEMGYKVARKHAEKLRRLVVICLGGAIIFCLMTLVMTPLLATIAAVLAVVWTAVAAINERWLFFAEAEHVVNLYYGKQAA